MSFDVEGLLTLWSTPMTAGPEAADRFRELYTDEVTVNGTVLTVEDLVDRAIAVQSAFDGLEREVLDVCEAGDKVAVGFRMGGRQVGPLTTSAGTVAATGRTVQLRVIDILTLTDGRISSITMVADELGALVGLDAVHLAGRVDAPLSASGGEGRTAPD
jgi:ketosteroid isomerase-like protein